MRRLPQQWITLPDYANHEMVNRTGCIAGLRPASGTASAAVRGSAPGLSHEWGSEHS